MINLCRYINFAWPLSIKWIQVTITHLLPNLYTLYTKSFAAFLSPLYFSKLMLIFHRFQQRANRREQSGILFDIVPESLKTHYIRKPWKKINAVIGNCTLQIN